MPNESLKIIERHLGEDFEILSSDQSKIKIHGFGSETFETSAFRRDFSFLKEGLQNCHYLKSDKTVIPESTLCYHNGKYFMTRGINPELTFHENTLTLNKIQEKDFSNCSIEPIMGYLIGSNKGHYDVMIHRYSGGIELASISEHAPSDLRNTLWTLTAKSIAELHSRRIIYSDPVPTNMRFNFTDRIILNPHQHIVCNSDNKQDRIRDLALFIKTNNWLPHQEQFIKEYADGMGSPKEWKSIDTKVTSYWENQDFDTELMPGIVPFWTQN